MRSLERALCNNSYSALPLVFDTVLLLGIVAMQRSKLNPDWNIPARLISATVLQHRDVNKPGAAMPGEIRDI